jgi:hypothetical protein
LWHAPPSFLQCIFLHQHFISNHFWHAITHFLSSNLSRMCHFCTSNIFAWIRRTLWPSHRIYLTSLCCFVTFTINVCHISSITHRRIEQEFRLSFFCTCTRTGKFQHSYNVLVSYCQHMFTWDFQETNAPHNTAAIT